MSDIRPEYYGNVGGKDNIYEPLKIIDHYNLPFTLANCTKYILRAGRKSTETRILDLKKAAFYLNHEIEKLEKDEHSKDLQ